MRDGLLIRKVGSLLGIGILLVSLSTVSCGDSNESGPTSGTTTAGVSDPCSGLSDCLPAANYRIFVTSQSYDGNLGGLAGADAKCQSLATGAEFTRTYKAILSDSTGTASGRITATAGIYYFTARGTKFLVANSAADLWNAGAVALQNAVGYDENYASTGGATVWTGSNSTGGLSAGSHCSDWSTNGAGTNGNFGASSSTSSTWLNTMALACNGTRRLYCISQ